jgi:N-acetylglucosaminyldiphosphoundecaprenol N-acetyl-beta-D-mannosaminyltransferase
VVKPDKINILGVNFSNVDSDEALERLLGFLDGNTARAVFTPNPEFVMLARKDTAFMAALNKADMNIPDGIGIVLASKLGKHKFKSRVTGYDTVQAIFSKIKDTGKTVYFYGGAPGVADEAKARMEEAYPGLKIVGVRNGYIDEAGQDEMIEEIKRLKPDMLIVGMSFGKQEQWIMRRKEDLPCKLLMGLGGALDVMSGRVRRAPAFVGKIGFEWLYRLIKQPSRIKRQIKLPLFMLAAIGDRLKKR